LMWGGTSPYNSSLVTAGHRAKFCSPNQYGWSMEIIWGWALVASASLGCEVGLATRFLYQALRCYLAEFDK